MQSDREVLISLKPQTTEERLIWANSYINELKERLKESQIRNGELNSMLQELIDTKYSEWRIDKTKKSILKVMKQNIELNDKLLEIKYKKRDY